MSDRNDSLQEAFLTRGPETARQYLEQEYLHQQGLTNLELIQAAFDRLPKRGKITTDADRIAVTSIAFLIDALPSEGRLKEAYLQKWKRLQKRAK
jgi:hypothetical protein